MKTQLIFVRHGFSESNRANLFTGQADIPLTGLGKRQADCAADYLKDISIDKIYSSTLCRAYETAKSIATMRDMDITQISGLCEINGGDWTEMNFDDISKKYPDEYNLWKNDMYNCTCPNGESLADFSKRVIDTVNEIAKNNEGKTVLIATHATPIRVISCCTLGIDLKNLKDVPWSPNASINIVDYEDDKFTFVKRDICEHLKGLETNLPSNI